MVLNALQRNNNNNNEVSKRQDALYGWTPLHICCLGRPPSYIIRAMLNAHAPGVAMVDQGGRLPLHLAAASGASEAVLVMLIDALPMSVEAVDQKGLTPIHMLFRNVVAAAADVSKSNRNHSISGHGSAPNHNDSMHDDYDNYDDNEDDLMTTTEYTSAINANVVSMMASRKSTRAVAHTTRQLPLHSACRFNSSNSNNNNGVSLEVLQILVAANPDALIAGDSKGRTPLMLALLNCWNTGGMPPSLPVVELLLGRVRSTTTAGSHSAASCCYHTNNNNNNNLGIRISADQMRLLVHNPAAKLAASMASTETGELPLHVAAQVVGTSSAVFEVLRDAYPDAVETEDLRGRVPLHHVLVNSSHRLPSPAVFDLLLTERVARSRDVDGKYPIDYLFDIEDLDLYSYKEAYVLDHDHDADQSMLTGETHSVLQPASAAASAAVRRKRHREYQSSEHASSLRQFFVPYNDGSDDDSSLGASDGRDREDYLDRLLFLPPWIREQAAATKYVQELLGDEVSKIMPMFILLLEFYVKCAMIVIYRIAIHEKVNEIDEAVTSMWAIFFLHGGGAFLLIRIISRAINFWHLRMFYDACFSDPWCWVDSFCMALVVGTTIWMHLEIESGVLHFVQFSEISAITTGFLWLQLISYLRTVWLRFSLFIDVVLRVSVGHYKTCLLLVLCAALYFHDTVYSSLLKHKYLYGRFKLFSWREALYIFCFL